MNVQMVALSGLNRAAAQLDAAAVRIARAADPESRVDLAAEMVALIQARNAASVNLRAIRAADEMEAHLVDLLG